MTPSGIAIVDLGVVADKFVATIKDASRSITHARVWLRTGPSDPWQADPQAWVDTRTPTRWRHGRP